jgi:hypothetical protein
MFRSPCPSRCIPNLDVPKHLPQFVPTWKNRTDVAIYIYLHGTHTPYLYLYKHAHMAISCEAKPSSVVQCSGSRRAARHIFRAWRRCWTQDSSYIVIAVTVVIIFWYSIQSIPVGMPFLTFHEATTPDLQTSRPPDLTYRPPLLRTMHCSPWQTSSFSCSPPPA